MKRIWEKYRKMKIIRQIHWAILAVSAASILFLGAFSYIFSKNIIEKNYREDFTSNLRSVNRISDIQLKSVMDASRNLLIDMNFVKALELSNTQERRYFTSETQQILNKSLGAVMQREMLIGEIVVIDNTGKLYSYALDTSDQKASWKEGILEEAWISVAEKYGGKEAFFGSNVLNESNTNTVSLVRSLINYMTGERIGYMVINIRKKVLSYSFGTLQDKFATGGQMVITSQNDYEVIFFEGEEEQKEFIYEQYLNERESSSEYIFASVESEISGWNLVSYVKRTELTKDSNIIGVMIFCVLMILIFLGAGFSKSVAARIYEPLYKLKETIEQMGEGNRNITERFDESEIGKIGERFKYIVNNNLELRERLLEGNLREREAELLLLQSQINPHFLYNTLDSLYCMAIIQEADDVAQMVDALSRNFRMSLNKGNKLILVKHEIEHIKAYMEVQVWRYKDRVSLELDIEKSIQNSYMLKFILQPFVENAMYHGLEPKIGKGIIKVSGKRQQGGIVFRIEDNGVGMKNVEEIENGYGVRNVTERIEMYYGKGYGINVHSKEGEGTTIEVSIANIDREGGKVCAESSGN